MEDDPVVDVATACRLCLMNENEEKMLEINQEISHVIHACSIQIFESSDFPARVCTNCFSILQFIYKFHKMCENSVMFLRETCLQDDNIEIVTKQDMEELVHEAISEPDDSAEVITNDEINEESMLETEAIEAIVRAESVSQQNSQNGDDDGMNNEEYVFEVNDNHGEEDDEELDIKTDINETQYECLESVNADEEESLWIEEAREHTHNDSDGNDYDQPTVYILNQNNQFKQQLKSKAHRALLRAKNNRQPSIKKESVDGSGKLYSCEICGQSYVRMNALESHRRRHRNSKPFECEICSESFDYNFKLERHMRKHTGAKPFTCEYCDRRFVDRSTMSRHQKIHRNERAYSCTTCGKSFTYYSVLKTHIMSHTGEKPYACGICDKGFHRASDLRNHLETLQHRKDPRVPDLLRNIRRKDEITLHGFN